MHLIYLDESGNTGEHKDPAQPIHLIAGLCVHESKIRPIEEAVRRIVATRFGVLALDPKFELHGADLYGGNGFFKGVDPAERIGAIHDVLGVLAANEATVMWAAIDKMKLYSGRHPHRLAFLLLVERVEDWLRSQGRLGLIVADENKEIEQNLIDDLDAFKAGTTGMGWRPTPITSIVDSVHFVQSINNRLIQCVDLIAHFTLKNHRQEQALVAEYRAMPGPQAPFPTWREAKLTPKTAAIHEIGRKILAITRATKTFP